MGRPLPPYIEDGDDADDDAVLGDDPPLPATKRPKRTTKRRSLQRDGEGRRRSNRSNVSAIYNVSAISTTSSRRTKALRSRREEPLYAPHTHFAPLADDDHDDDG